MDQGKSLVCSTEAGGGGGDFNAGEALRLTENKQRTFMRLILKLKEDLPDFVNRYLVYNSAY